MASVVVAIGAVVYFSAVKVHKHNEKKHALKAQEALEQNLIAEQSTTDDKDGFLHGDEYLSASHNENLPPYHSEDQHPAVHADTKSARHHGLRLKKYIRGGSDVKMWR